MKLDPVYVLAPEDRRPSRRALLWFGLGFGVTAATGIGGYLLGRSVAGAEDSRSPRAGPAAVDPRVAWARRLADDSTPLGALLDNDVSFLGVLQAHAPDDAMLWHGVERLCRAVVEDAGMPQRAPRARLLLGLLRALDPPGDLDIRRWVPGLEAAARR